MADAALRYYRRLAEGRWGPRTRDAEALKITYVRLGTNAKKPQQ